MNVCLILAAGNAERHNGGNKPLLKVGKETLLERMVRQIKPHVSHIYIITHRDDLIHPGCKVFAPKFRKTITDTLLSTTQLWSLTGTTIALLGDVYYADKAIDDIVNSTKFLQAFGHECNIHALAIGFHGMFAAIGELTRFCQFVDDPDKYCHGKLYGFVRWASISTHRLDDLTTDIDSPVEHKRLLAKLEL